MKLDIDIEARFAKFQDSLNNIERMSAQTADRMKGKFAGLELNFNQLFSAAAITGFTLFIKNAIDAADALNDISDRTGVSGEKLFILQNAAERTGGSLEALEGVLGKLPKILNDAADGSGKAAEAMKRLGVDPREGLTDMYGFLEKVGKGLQGIKNDGERANIAILALGKGGDRMIPALLELEKTRKRMEELGIAMDDAFLKKAGEFNDRMDDLSALTKQWGRDIAVGLLPSLTGMSNMFIELRGRGDALVSLGSGIGDFFTSISKFALTTKYEFESLVNVVTGLSESFMAMRLGEFSAAGDIFNRMRERAGEIRNDFERASLALRGLEGPPVPEPESTQRSGGVVEDDSKLQEVEEARQKMLEAMAKIELESTKRFASDRLKILESFYKDGVVSEDRYWQDRFKIAQEAYDQEASVLDRQVERLRGIRDKQKEGTKEYYDAEIKLAEAVAARKKLSEEKETEDILTIREKARATRDYANAVQDLKDQIADLEGRTAESVGSRFDRQSQSLSERLKANADKDGQEALARLRQLTVAQAAYSDEAQRAAIIEQELANVEARTRTSQAIGAISEFEAMQKIGEARAATLPQLQAIADKMREIAAASGNPKLVADADTFRSKIEQIAADADVFGNKIRGTFTDAAADSLANFMKGTMSAGDAFKAFGKKVLDTLVEMEAKWLASKIFGGGGGSIFGSILGLFSGGGGGAGNFVASSLTGSGSTDDWISYAASLATGGGMEKSLGGSSTIQITYAPQIDARSDQAQIVNIVRQGGEQVKKDIYESMNRAGAFAK